MIPERLYQASDFVVTATQDGLVEVRVEGNSYLIHPKQARKISLKMMKAAMGLDEDAGITIHFNCECYSMHKNEIIAYANKVYYEATKALAKRELQQ